jgi:hypothetical protein
MGTIMESPPIKNAIGPNIEIGATLAGIVSGDLDDRFPLFINATATRARIDKNTAAQIIRAKFRIRACGILGEDSVIMCSTL